jgi:hypothetical protein
MFFQWGVPFPGGYAVLGVMTINLIAKFLEPHTTTVGQT